MRLFIATKASISNLTEIQQAFLFTKIKWVEPYNLHLTYHFLGDRFEVDEIIQKIPKIALPATIKFQTLCTFQTNTQTILYVKPQEQEELIKIYHDIAQSLNIQPHRAFLPHITIARIKGTLKPTLPKIIPQGKLAKEVQLISSTLTPKGPIYKVLHTF